MKLAESCGRLQVSLMPLFIIKVIYEESYLLSRVQTVFLLDSRYVIVVHHGLFSDYGKWIAQASFLAIWETATVSCFRVGRVAAYSGVSIKYLYQPLCSSFLLTQ